MAKENPSVKSKCSRFFDSHSKRGVRFWKVSVSGGLTVPVNFFQYIDSVLTYNQVQFLNDKFK